MADKKTFLEAVRDRRSIYALNKEIPISDDRIIELATEAVKHAPSAFNSQTARLVVLLKEEHDQFWDIVKETLTAKLPAERHEATIKKLNGFRAGYGTVRLAHA